MTLRERPLLGRLRDAVPLALSGWLGAVVLFATVVAPALFAVLPSRSLAGAAVSRILPPLFVAGALLGCIAIIAARGIGQPRRARAAIAFSGLLVVCCVIAQGVVAPAISRTRARMGEVAPAALPASDARRQAFGRLHASSVLALGIGALGALGAAVAFTLPGIPRDLQT